MNPPHATLADIATQAGVAPSSVSRALRGAPGVSARLRARIKKLAVTCGYQADPGISAAMSALRRSQRLAYRETIAVVYAHPGCLFTEEVRGIRERASELGYKVEEYHLSKAGKGWREMGRMMHARGIRGVLPMPDINVDRPRLNLPWSRFAVVLTGSSFASTGLYRVQHDHYGGTSEALRQLRRLGCRRIALIITRGHHERSKHRQMAALYAHSGMRGEECDALTFFIETNNTSTTAASFETCARWLERTRPDAILFQRNSMLSRLREAGWRMPLSPPPPGCILATLNLESGPDCLPMPGVICNLRDIGREAVNQLCTLLQTGRLGLHACPPTIFIPGTWHP